MLRQSAFSALLIAFGIVVVNVAVGQQPVVSEEVEVRSVESDSIFQHREYSFRVKITADVYKYDSEFETSPSLYESSTTEYETSADLEGELTGTTVAISFGPDFNFELALSKREGDVEGTLEYEDFGADADVDGDVEEIELRLGGTFAAGEGAGFGTIFGGILHTEQDLTETLERGFNFTGNVNTKDRELESTLLFVGGGYGIARSFPSLLGLTLGARVEGSFLLGRASDDDQLDLDDDTESGFLAGLSGKATAFAEMPVPIIPWVGVSLFGEAGGMVQHWWMVTSGDMSDSLSGFYGRFGASISF